MVRASSPGATRLRHAERVRARGDPDDDRHDRREDAARACARAAHADWTTRKDVDEGTAGSPARPVILIDAGLHMAERHTEPSLVCRSAP